MADELPEGTDQIVTGAGSNNNRSTEEDASSAGARNGAENGATSSGKAGAAGFDAADFKEKASAKASEFRSHATDKARDYAEQGKERASAGLDSVAKMIGDGAAQVDGALGESYGDYVRRAADAVSGFSDTLREKEVDELVDDARGLIRKSPAIAIGAAAAAGFVLARIIKAGSEVLDEAAKSTTKASDTGAPNDASTKSTAKSRSGE
jgi:ElaB/YqjD/DUF883 family membrane-anchored ribosome-binding protein